MGDKFEWWYFQRARARAILLLTERDDSELRFGSDEGHEMDLYVCPKPVFPAHSNILGIQVQGNRELPAEAARQMSASALAEFDPLEWPHPACLFLFEAYGEEAFYQWLAEPVSNGHNALVKPDSAKPGRLDAAVVAEIFDRTRQWYGALAAERAA